MKGNCVHGTAVAFLFKNRLATLTVPQPPRAVEAGCRYVGPSRVERNPPQSLCMTCIILVSQKTEPAGSLPALSGQSAREHSVLCEPRAC